MSEIAQIKANVEGHNLPKFYFIRLKKKRYIQKTLRFEKDRTFLNMCLFLTMTPIIIISWKIPRILDISNSVSGFLILIFFGFHQSPICTQLCGFFWLKQGQKFLSNAKHRLFLKLCLND